jgi:hypothetical protein
MNEHPVHFVKVPLSYPFTEYHPVRLQDASCGTDCRRRFVERAASREHEIERFRIYGVSVLFVIRHAEPATFVIPAS